LTDTADQLIPVFGIKHCFHTSVFLEIFSEEFFYNAWLSSMTLFTKR